MLSGLLTILLLAVALVLVVLIIALQHGNEGGIGAAFGSGNSTGFFGASGGVSVIIRATWICGALFFGIAMALSWVKTHDHFGVGKEIKGLLSDDAAKATPPSTSATAGAAVSPAGTSAPALAAPTALPSAAPAISPAP
jgi:preprotein translocase subunit SecG